MSRSCTLLCSVVGSCLGFSPAITPAWAWISVGWFWSCILILVAYPIMFIMAAYLAASRWLVKEVVFLPHRTLAIPGSMPAGFRLTWAGPECISTGPRRVSITIVVGLPDWFIR